MKTKTAFLFLIIIIAAAIGAWRWQIAHDEYTAPAASSYQDATYVIEGQNVTLKGGVAEEPIAPGSASKAVTRYFGNEAMGDLNGDGTPDVAFILTRDTGGSGTFYYAVAALKTDDGYVGTNAVYLGDRIAPQPTTIKDGVVTVNYADRAAGEPMTARPSVGVSKYLRVDAGVLVEGNAPVSQIANPASVNCVEARGGSLSIVDTAAGQVGYCDLPDGRTCEEWDLFRDGTCTPPTSTTPTVQ